MKTPKTPIIKYKTVVSVAEAAIKKGITNPHQLHSRTNISVPRATKLWKGTGKFTPDDIDRLCDALPCKIKDIVKRVPESEITQESSQEDQSPVPVSAGAAAAAASSEPAPASLVPPAAPIIPSGGLPSATSVKPGRARSSRVSAVNKAVE